jgi:hypothetical protein
MAVSIGLAGVVAVAAVALTPIEATVRCGTATVRVV